MKVVLDTNVLIAALIASGTCAELLEHCVLHHTIIGSEFILKELRGHLTNKFKFTDQETDEAIELLRSQMEIVTPAVLEQATCRDADDDQILGTALRGQAQCIVTGDRDLLILKNYKGVEIMSPSNFVDFETA